MWCDLGCDGVCGVLVTIFVVIFGVLALHYIYLLWNCDYWKKRGVFCPNSKSLFGNLPGQVNGKRHILYDLDDLYKGYKDKFPYIGIYQFRQPRLLVFDPEVMKDIMIKYFKNFQGTEMYGTVDKTSDPLFGNHPFVLVGDEWKKKRSEVSPAFTSSRIKAIFPIAQNVCEKMISHVKSEIAKEDFDGLDAKDLAARFTISIVCNSIYNIDPKSFEGQESEIMTKSKAFLVPTKRFMIYMMLDTLYPFWRKYLKFGFSQAGTEKFFIDLMDEAIKHREEHKIQNLDYLDHLMNLRHKKEISDLDLAGHGASFLVDGFDTSSSAISSALKEIAENKEVQEKLRQEINDAMPNEEDFTYDNIMNLPYLDQVWHETLRLHSPGAYLSRYCNEPVEVDMPKDKKLYFEEGSIILFPICSMHMDPEYFPDPEKFDPDRFAPENGGVKACLERGVFVPFGIGPRICVGNRFAISQSKIAIAALVKNFEISINPKSPKEYVSHPQAIIITLTGCVLDFKEIKKD